MLLTVLFDSVYTWTICVPFAFIMVRFTGLGIEQVYPLCYLTDILKCIIGVLVIRTGRWAKNIIGFNGLNMSETPEACSSAAASQPVLPLTDG